MSDANTREAILDVAAGLFAAHGYDAISMRDVAAAAKISTIRLYGEFMSKDELARMALLHVFEEKTEVMEASLQNVSSPQQRFGFFIAWFVRMLFEDPVFSRLVARELIDGSPDRIGYICRTVFRRPFALLTETIAECAPQADAALSALSVVAIILGHYQLVRALPHLPGCRTDYGHPGTLFLHFAELLKPAFKEVGAAA